MKNRWFNSLLIIAAFAATCLAIAGGSYFRASLSVEVGQISDRKIKATADVENRIATEFNRARAQEAADRMEPILMLDYAVWEQVLDNLDSLFDRLELIRLTYEQETAEHAIEAERLAQEAADEAARREEERLIREAAAAHALLEEGLDEPLYGGDDIPEEEPVEEPAEPEEEPLYFMSLEMFLTLPIIFTVNQQMTLLTMEDEDFAILKSAARIVSATVLEQGVSEIDSKTLLAVQDEFSHMPIDSELMEIGYEIVAGRLLPNVIINEDATQREREKIAENYVTVMLLQDQTIVDEGEPVSEEAYDMMLSLGMLDAGFENVLLPMAGVFALVSIIFVLAVLYLSIFHKSMVNQRKEAFLLFTLYTMVLAVVWTIGDVAYHFLPLLVFSMLVSFLINTRASIFLSIGMTIICYFIVNGSLDYLLFFTIAGVMVGLLSRYTTERAKVFVVGIIVMAAQFVLSIAISLIIEWNHALIVWQNVFTTAGFAALNGMLTVIICMGSMPFWEVFFGVVTPVKLLDLTNPTNILLRRLTIEAPGTYHHSLIVANLAETAALDIGANPHTARAGGYYHDIGKLKYPHYFIENLAGENPHDHLDPYNSVQLILSHVAYGMTLASEYKLPAFLRDIIKEHHGTSLIKFFFNKAKNDGLEKEVDESEFRYPYTIPQTRESACVMLADTVEAAVRSMIPYVKSVDEVEEQIKVLIRDKLNDGQLEDSQLSIKDVAAIEKSFFRVLKGMYHERIPYTKVAVKEE